MRQRSKRGDTTRWIADMIEGAPGGGKTRAKELRIQASREDKVATNRKKEQRKRLENKRSQ